MNRSEQINEVIAALAKAQGMMTPAYKDSVNPHYKSSYADLESVMRALREPLSSNGLALAQFPSTEGSLVSVETILGHAASGQFLGGELRARAKSDDPQAIGSAITYLRRYGAMAITGLAPSDDDGNAAVEHRPQTGKSFGGVFDPDDKNDIDWLAKELTARKVPQENDRKLWTAIKHTMVGLPRDRLLEVILEVVGP